MNEQNYKSNNRNVGKGGKPGKGQANKYGRKGNSNRDNRDSNTGVQSRDSERVSDLYGSKNDFAWYNHDPQLISDASKIPFANQAGIPIPWPQAEVNAATGEGISREPVPGIMSFDMLLGPGVAASSSDGLNIAAQGVFEYIRKNLSTVADYNSADVMCCILGIDYIYAMYSYILRLFGLANAYSSRNFYLPKDILKASSHFNDQGVETLIANLNNYRSLFNNIVYKAASLYMPITFSMTNRHSWLFTNVFRDSESSRSQLYVHRLSHLGYLDETSYDSGTAITYVEENSNNMDQLLKAFDEMVEEFRNSDSMRRIQADMRRAYGDKFSSWQLAYCPENYMIQPMYSRDVLLQIHNMDIVPVGGMYGLTNLDITQDVNRNILISQPVFPNPAAYSTGFMGAVKACRKEGSLVNMFWDDISDADIVEATRSKVTLDPNIRTFIIDGETAPGIALTSYGLDICTGVATFTKELEGDLDRDVVLYSNFVFPITETEQPDVGFYANTLTRVVTTWAAFDWAPILYLPLGSTDGSSILELKPFLDWNNWQLIPTSTMYRLNNNVSLSIWKVPEYGELSGK